MKNTTGNLKEFGEKLKEMLKCRPDLDICTIRIERDMAEKLSEILSHMEILRTKYAIADTNLPGIYEEDEIEIAKRQMVKNMMRELEKRGCIDWDITRHKELIMNDVSGIIEITGNLTVFTITQDPIDEEGDADGDIHRS